jgi:hypothetical protein
MTYGVYYNSIQQSIVQRYLAMIKEADVKHAPLISNLLTEELLKSEIVPHLPEGLYISKGEVVNGAASSGDCDLIVYRKPVIYQYGPIVIVPRENARAIIDVEIHGEKFLKAFYQDNALSSRVAKKKRDIEFLKEFADKIFCLGLHAHAKAREFELWIKNRHLTQIPIFIFYTRHNKQIIEGEFERLINEIQRL